METFVLYMYRVVDNLKTYNDDKVIQISSVPLVALLDSDNPSELTRKQKVDMYNLRPFELQQNLIDYSIKLFPKNNARILGLEFDFLIDDELDEELEEAIQDGNYLEIDNLIKEIREEGYDIKAVTFMFDSRQFRVTKYGVVEVDGSYDELPNLTYNSPVALFTGMRKNLEGKAF